MALLNDGVEEILRLNFNVDFSVGGEPWISFSDATESEPWVRSWNLELTTEEKLECGLMC